ncbi:hypothetical protein QFZ77_006453 [Paenibacillus sp. V4I3]|nr:hypothetical protein [Paenibacillus sp. V4I3]
MILYIPHSFSDSRQIHSLSMIYYRPLLNAFVERVCLMKGEIKHA